MKYLSPALFLLSSLATTASAGVDECLLEAIKSAEPSMTVAELRDNCESLKETAIDTTEQKPDTDNTAGSQQPPVKIHKSKDQKLGAASRRLALEYQAYQNRFALEAHKPNYLLPLVYLNQRNQPPFVADYDDPLDSLEVQFQLSLKATLAKGALFGRGRLYLGYTNKSFWQAYNSNVSRPFRETNHEPELWLSFESPLTAFGLNNVTNSIGINHQSNGRSGAFSRSWNRIIASSVWEKDNFAFALRTWYRLPENEEDFPGDPEGDDNPDIDDFLGYGDYRFAYSSGHHTWSLKLRNFVTGNNRGAVEFSWSFPFGDRVGGYINYFNGYGESLIDYNAKTESLGLGIELTDWL